LVASQAAQACPPAPQVERAGVLQVEPMQHPPGQDEALQMHAPFMQCCPGWQAGPPPQRQAPVSEQVSAVLVSQLVQAAAPTPQLFAERG
jgi:hypothetical protein